MESYTAPALFGSLQMRRTVRKAVRKAYFQTDMVNCDAIATGYLCGPQGPEDGPEDDPVDASADGAGSGA